jgi:DNA-binding IscR family transcriptional regulator
VTSTNNTLTLTQLLSQLSENADEITFEQVMQVINDNYSYTPTAFKNGDVNNASGTNEGSCKIFTFAKLNILNEAQTLACFGRFYRQDVLENPAGDDHGNIRNFIKTGWQGIEFEKVALTAIN